MRRRYIQIEGVLHEVGRDYIPEPKGSAHLVMPDIKPYKSMVDGSLITSRSHHREHLRQHNCIEVGNDSSVLHPVYKPRQSPSGLKEKIIRAVEQMEQKARR